MSETSIYYFAYGANMSSKVMHQRRRIFSTLSEAAVLADHRLSFDLPGLPLLEPAFASVVPEQASAVHGVLHRLTLDELQRLDRMESRSYARQRRMVHTRSLGEIEAEVYVNQRPHPNLLPSRRYLDLLLEGAREHGLPEPYLAFLSTHPRGDVPALRPVAHTAVRLFSWLTRIR